MRVGIIGSPMIGATLGPLWMRAGHAVRFGTRHPEQVRVEGAPATTVAEAAAWAEVLLLAVPLGAVPDVAGSSGSADTTGATGSALEGKVVLDATNPIAHREPAADRQIEAEGTGSGRWVVRYPRAARVVKAFNTVCRFTTRPALWDERIQLNAACQLELNLKTKFQWRPTCTQVTSERRHRGATGRHIW